MKCLKVIAGSLFLVLLQLHNVSLGEGEIRQLTSIYKPPEWKLYPLYPNPFSPCFRTEFSVQEVAKLSIEVWSHRSDDTPRSLVRQIAETRDDVFMPAVYSLEWSFCDSLDLPMTTTGLFDLVMHAYPKSDPIQLVFHDSTVVLAFAPAWTDVMVDSGDIGIRVMNGWILEESKLVKTSVISPFPRVYVHGARRLKAKDSADSDRVVISIGSLNEPVGHYVPLSYVKGYLCLSDGSEPSGFRIERAKRPFHGLYTTWELDLEEGDQLLLICDSSWPIVLNPSTLLKRLRAAGNIK